MGRSLEELKPVFKERVLKLLDLCRFAGINLLITRTGVTDFQQKALYKIGRSPLVQQEVDELRKVGMLPSSLEHTVTNAKNASETPHGVGLAIDCIPLKDMAPDWNFNNWQKVYELARECGLEDITKTCPWDKGHIQQPNWRNFNGNA